MSIRPSIAILAGALLTVILAIMAASRMAGPYAEDLAARAAEIAEDKVAIRFADREGFPSRHAMLTPVQEMDEVERANVAQAIATVPGIGGVHWTDGTMLAEAGETPTESMRCQDDVQAILGARSIRFEESSASLAAGGTELLDEVAAALRPCFGARIAITGHTDSSGDEPSNVLLSQRRAAVVEHALIARGLSEEKFQVRGLGSSQPVEGLDPADPANRRIEFSVLAQQPIRPTPIDTPGPR